MVDIFNMFFLIVRGPWIVDILVESRNVAEFFIMFFLYVILEQHGPQVIGVSIGEFGLARRRRRSRCEFETYSMRERQF